MGCPLKTLTKRLNDLLKLQKQKGLWRKLEVSGSYDLDLSRNDYFQLRNHPTVLHSSEIAQREFGTSSGASPLISGFLPCHNILLTSLLNLK